MRVTQFVTEHEAREWARLASNAYSAGRNDFGHRFSVAAACYWPSTDGRLKEIDPRVFDTLQTIYRRWLIGGWSEVERPQ